MTRETVKDFYNRQYRLHRDQHSDCPNALHDLSKARRRVATVVAAFNLPELCPSTKVLDVGSGLGYYTKALSLTGADVTGLDFSEAAVEAACSTFPECRFVQGTWPDDVLQTAEFDLIWMVNFSVMNTFDVDFIRHRLVDHAVRRLRPGGALIVGWNSDLSGRTLGGYSHWPWTTLRQLQRVCGLSVPLVPQAKTTWLTPVALGMAYLSHRSVPIFMHRRS